MNPRGNVLIVDDEPNLRQTLSRVLQVAGCTVTAAANGTEALRLIDGNRYDLIYLDIHLPDISGLDVLREIHQRQPDTPVILFTAHASVQSAIDAMRLGAIDYLIKPVDPEAFIARTRIIIAERATDKRRRELQAQIEALQAELAQLDKKFASFNPASPPPAASGERFLKYHKLILDLQARRGTLEEDVLALPPAAFDYLVVLARHAPNTVDYQTLVNEAQGYQTEAFQAKDLAKWHIHQLRDAIEPDPDTPKYIVNMRGVGYRLVVD